MLQSVREFNWEAKQDEHPEYSRLYHHMQVKHGSRMRNPPASIPESAHNMLPTLEIIKSISDVRRSYPYSGELGTIWLFKQCRGLAASASLRFPALFAIPIDILVARRLSDLHRRAEC